jgi:hypothetical protein
MRELIGKLPTHDRNVTQKVYRCEAIRCQKCQRTVPLGIEVVTINTLNGSVARHEYYCRADAFDSHGLDYEHRIQTRPIRKSPASETRSSPWGSFAA